MSSRNRPGPQERRQNDQLVAMLVSGRVQEAVEAAKRLNEERQKRQQQRSAK